MECGERRAPLSSALLGVGTGTGPAGAGSAGSGRPTEPPAHLLPGGERPWPGDGPGRNQALTIIAGVGVLLLAMGIGVLIGRSGGSSGSGRAPVISVASTPSSGASPSAPAASSTAFTDDWPAGTNGYTVQLQTLPQSSTQVSAVEAAKTAATAKGATGVGALKSEDFSSLTAGSYVIYSGVYKKQPEAQRAVAGLKKSFPGAKVIHVSSGEGSTNATKGAGSTTGGAGSAGATSPGISKTTPPATKAAEKLTKSSGGKNYEQESKALPNKVET